MTDINTITKKQNSNNFFIVIVSIKSVHNRKNKYVNIKKENND